VLEDVLHSDGHTNLQGIGSPKTSTAMRRNSTKRRAMAEVPPVKASNKKAKRLSNENVAKFLVDAQIKTEQELYKVSTKIDYSVNTLLLHIFLYNHSGFLY